MANHLSCKPTKDEVLALDIASQTGYYSVHESGAWNFYESKQRNDNKQHKAFRDTLIEYIKTHNIKQVVAEDVNVNSHFYDMRKLCELRGILLEVCDELELPEPVFVNVMSLKKFATGNGKASKVEMIKAAESKYNFHAKNDDEADAFWIFKYYCNKYRVF